jgi:beta-lactamase regulating signal transducer with metallopeptidase domain
LNALGLTLLGSIAHATVFALLGAMFYLALRRSSPAAGALAAGSCLLFMAIVSAIVLGPWPRWYTIPAPATVALTRAPVSTENSVLRATQPQPDVSRGGPEDSSERRLNSTQRSETVESFQSPFEAFVREFSRAATAPSNARAPSQLSWPNWLAAGFLISLFVGFARLGLGLLAVGRLRSRSRPLDDVTLLEEIELLRAELSCTRRVEVRESSELETPATLGWRRPLVLLPFDWRDWSHDELRAVLAHELAHVVRGDFLAGLIAQLSVALHFYHPLAHWLAKRLRLEQELAADAWGAALSGGSPSYLMTLAQMALKREDRSLAGPVRAFLPSRGTLVTRIEMLRNTHVFRTGSLPARARAATIGILALIGLAVAGLRGPTGQAQSLAQTIPGEGGQAAGQGGSRGNSASLDLSLLPAETKALIALKPAALLEKNEIKELVQGMRQGNLARFPFEFEPEEVEQFAFFWEGLPDAPGHPGGPAFVPPPSGIVVRTTKAQQWKKRLAAQFGSAEELRLDGQACFRLGRPPIPGSLAFTSDDRTVLFSSEDTLRDLIQDRRAKAPRRIWDDAWEKSAGGQVIVAVETRWLRRRLAQASPPGGPHAGPPLLETVAPLLEKARAYVLSLETSGGINVDIRALTGGADDAKPVAETMQAVITLARNSVEGLSQESAGRPLNPALKTALAAAASLLSQAKIETSGNVVHVQAKSTVDLSELAKSLAPAVTTARAAASRAQSINNLKQIGLAFHNYAQANNHFPPPVLTGGEQGKFPYSWRVALLPYLEHDALYRKYRFDEPWDGPHNRELIEQMPAVYSVSGGSGAPLSRSNTSYYVFSGPTTALGSPWAFGSKNSGPTTLAEITDGMSNTILAVEWDGNVPWTKPDDIPFDPNGPVPALGGFWPEVFNVLMCDGSVRSLKKEIFANILKALITKAGGEVIQGDAFGPGQAVPRPLKQ